MEKFKKEGIDKIVEALGGDVKELVGRLKAMVDASKGYNSFSGKSGDMAGKVKFIYTTDGVKKAEEEKK